MHGESRRPLAIQALGSQKVPLILINGVDVSTTNGVITLAYPLNALEAYGTMKGGLIFIRNLDHYDTVTIKDCVASPVTSLS